jgi:hypothetical protein
MLDSAVCIKTMWILSIAIASVADPDPEPDPLGSETLAGSDPDPK